MVRAEETYRWLVELPVAAISFDFLGVPGGLSKPMVVCVVLTLQAEGLMIAAISLAFRPAGVPGGSPLMNMPC